MIRNRISIAVLGLATVCMVSGLMGCGGKDATPPPVDYATTGAGGSQTPGAGVGSGKSAGGGGVADPTAHPAPAGVQTGNMAGGQK